MCFSGRNTWIWILPESSRKFGCKEKLFLVNLSRRTYVGKPQNHWAYVGSPGWGRTQRRHSPEGWEAPICCCTSGPHWITPNWPCAFTCLPQGSKFWVSRDWEEGMSSPSAWFPQWAVEASSHVFWCSSQTRNISTIEDPRAKVKNFNSYLVLCAKIKLS